MKLIRWVEVHIGRSRKKAKKTPTKQQGSPRCGDGPSESLARASPSAAATRLRSGEQNCSRVGDPDGPGPRAKTTAPLQPQAGSLSKPSVAHIRTSFLDQAPVSPADANSPRQRSRIKTNPWIASPRSPCGSSSADSGWAGSRSSTGSEGSEPGDMTSLILHEPSWRGGCHWASLGSLPPARSHQAASLLGASPLRPRTASTLDRRPSPLIGSSDLRLASATTTTTTRRPESARLQRRQPCGRSLFGTRISDNDSSASSDDEAYSEDFFQSEDSSDVVTVVKAAGTPQTDSACDPGSCTTTPLSECSSQLQRTETLADKVRRLRAQRVLVQQKMHEARVEEQASREQRIRLHRELMQFRRLMLLHSLQGLRSDLEQRTACLASYRGGQH